MIMELILWATSILLSVALYYSIREILKNRKHLKKYSPIIDIDKELSLRQLDLKKIENVLIEENEKLTSLKKDLEHLIDIDNISSSGFYENKYPFVKSEQYEIKIAQIREEQKQCIRNKNAIICSTEWTVNGSKKDGRKKIDQVIKLGLSAFNVQCDNEILKVKFDNIDRAEDRIHKIRSNIDKLLDSSHCSITDKFLKLKIQELFLVYEYQEKMQKEKEEQRAIKEQMREEEKARREIEKIQSDAEKEEKRYSLALEKAKADLDNKSEKERLSLQNKILDLEAKLKEAIENKERAKSQAEMTRRGHVYIISNIGSFGENIFKIGMTRRLDPIDRVDELSDASVPFDFDIHAMIRSEDAPKLEKLLHDKFRQHRMNMVNERKEFFKVELSQIISEVKSFHKEEIQLTMIAEAKEWRQTIAKDSAATKKAA